MLKRSVVVRLRDTLGAIDEAREFFERPDFDFFESNVMVQRAVERCIEIVSEASRHIPAELTDQYPDIPWQEMRAIGNVMRHEYQRVEDHVIWRTATKSFDPLRPIILELIASLEQE